jgi:hypothetical protein
LKPRSDDTEDDPSLDQEGLRRTIKLADVVYAEEID